MALYLVETISVFRIRYLVNAACPEYANSAIMAELDEFTQKHLDEIITSTREITSDEANRIYTEDNEFPMPSSLESYVTRV